MKKVFCAFLVFMIFCTSAFAAQPLYKKTVKETVTGGVSRTNIKHFYGSYSLNIDLITADLKNEHISIDLLKNSGGSDKVDTVMNLAKSQKDVVAATNADFFSFYKDTQNFSLGLEVKDGELLQSHINPDMAAGLFKDGALAFSYLEFSGTVTAPNGKSAQLTHINKPTDYYGAVIMYTPDFNGGTSPFLPEGITALTVVDDVVTASGTSLGGTIPIPEDGYILVIDDNMTPFLKYNFNIGDEVKVDLSTAELLEGVDTAFGGGTLLLKDGKKTKITHDVSGNNPRTAIGTNADGTVVYLLTVDGRQDASRGVTLDVLADICLETGMVNAMNFDGGGSTAMVAKTLSNEEIHYINSPSEKRKVINAVAITSDAKKGETAGYIASPASSYVLAGDSVKIKLTPYDENYNKPTKTPYTHQWKVAEGKGYVKDDVYYAEGSGKTVLDLYYNGQKNTSVTINVIDEVCGILTPAALDLTLNKQTEITGVAVFDAQGHVAMVNDLSLLNPVCAPFVTISGNGVTATKEGAGLIIFRHGNAYKGIKLTCGDYDIPLVDGITTDPLCKEASNGTSFNIIGFGGEETILDRLVYMKSMEVLRKGDISAVLGEELLGEFTPEAVSPLDAKKWKEYNHDNAKIISVDLTDSGVFARGDQWSKFSTAVKNASQKNVFILLDKNPAFSQSLDSSAFTSMLETAAKDKNVFVITNGNENFCSILNGVRYITITDTHDAPTAKDAVSEAKYLSFNITDSGINYCFRNIFEIESENNDGIVLE